MSYPVITTQSPLNPGYQAGYPQAMPAYPQPYPQAYPQAPVYSQDTYQRSAPAPYAQPSYGPQAYGYPQQQGYAYPQQQAYGYPQHPGYTYYPQPLPNAPQAQPSAQGVAGFGALIAGIVGLFKRPKAQPQAQAPMAAPQVNFPVPDRNQMTDEAFVADLYRRLLGREPDAGGFQAHLNGLRSGVNRQDLVRIFMESDEYRQRQAGMTAAPMQMPAPLPTAPTVFQIPQPAPMPVPAGPSAPLEGFDFNKLNDPNHRTPKYLFARTVQHVSLAGVHDQASAEALLRSIRPQLEAAGMRILDVKNDKIHVVTEIGAEWVDVIRGAGAPNPAWWWGSEGVGTPVPNMPAPGLPQPGPAPQLPGNALPSMQTVPVRPEYASVPVDKSSVAAAIVSTATWVKQNFPAPFQTDDRAQHYDAMTKVIGILRAHGYDAHRVVNHTSRGVGDPWRYGSDALVLNGRVFDVYAGIGDPNMSRPQAMDVGAYEAGRLRE